MPQQDTKYLELEKQINELQCANSIAAQDAASAEKRYLKLRYLAEYNINLESHKRFHKLQAEILANREADYQERIKLLKNHLEELKSIRSMRIAAFLQILKNPQLAGAKNIFGVLVKLLKGELKQIIVSGKHSLVNQALQMSDDALAVAQTCRHHDIEENFPVGTVDESRLISIVLPVYNQADMVHESIDSILAQTYRNWELIIINDGSTDNLYEKVKPYLSDKRIHYFEQQNQKLPFALNNGFAFTSGELLTWTSADNIMRPHMLDRLSVFLNTHPDIDMVYADYMVIDDRGNPFTEEWFRPYNKYFVSSPYLHLPRTTDTLNMIQDNFIGASFMYRRSAMRLIGEYDNTLGIEDYDYWMRINSMLKIAHLGSNEILYDYRIHDNTLSAKSAEFNILQKGYNLMHYETQRYYFYFRAFDVYGSYDANNYYHGEFPVNYCGKHRDINKLPNGNKQVLLINGNELGEYSFEELGSYEHIAAIFDHGEAIEVGKYAWLLRHFNILCFAAPYSAEAERIDLFAPAQTYCTPSDALFRFLIHANSCIFTKLTRPGEAAKRILPYAIEPENTRIIILLNAVSHGGLEQVAYDMVKSFTKANKEVLLVSFEEKADGVKIPEGINYVVLDQQDPENDFKRLLTEKPCQAVFAHFCLKGAKTAFEANVPFFQVVHNTYVWLTAPEIEPHIAADQYTAGYIAVSARVAHYALERMRLPANKMMIIENGTDFSRFKAAEIDRNQVRQAFGYTGDEFVLLNPASVYGAKGQINLIRAFAAAYRQNPSLRLIFAGKVVEENYCQDVRNIIAENALENVVSVGNYYENMADIYTASDAVVLPSFWEGCSLAAAEATFFKKPLLSSKTGDIERQTEYKNCIIYDLPLRYCTDLIGENYGELVYRPNQQIIQTLAEGILNLAAGNYCKSAERPATAQLADEAYGRYLKMLNYFGNGIPVHTLRCNI